MKTFEEFNWFKKQKGELYKPNHINKDGYEMVLLLVGNKIYTICLMKDDEIKIQDDEIYLFLHKIKDKKEYLKKYSLTILTPLEKYNVLKYLKKQKTWTGKGLDSYYNIIIDYNLDIENIKHLLAADDHGLI